MYTLSYLSLFVGTYTFPPARGWLPGSPKRSIIRNILFLPQCEARFIPTSPLSHVVVESSDEHSLTGMSYSLSGVNLNYDVMGKGYCVRHIAFLGGPLGNSSRLKG